MRGGREGGGRISLWALSFSHKGEILTNMWGKHVYCVRDPIYLYIYIYNYIYILKQQPNMVSAVGTVYVLLVNNRANSVH